MKIFRIIIPVLLFSAWMMTSCDKLDPPYATVKTSYDTANKPFVLLEEYTGHKCNNCPLATQKAHKMAEYYGGKVILMSVHATDLALPDPKYVLDLMTPEGTYWCTKYALSYVPRALVNRAIVGSGYPVNSDKWGVAIEEQMAKGVRAFVKVSASYNGSSKEVTASVTTWFKQALSSNAKINLFILEDSIQGLQANKDTAAGPTPDIDPYFFNYTFRAAMTDKDGDQLTPTVEVNKAYTFTKTFPANTAWNTKQLSVVATVVDPTSGTLGEIIGVAKTKVSSAK